MEFALTLFIFPFIVLILSIIITLLLNKWFAMPIITFVVFLILTFTVFNETFFIWVVAYTILALIISIITVTLRNIFRR